MGIVADPVREGLAQGIQPVRPTNGEIQSSATISQLRQPPLTVDAARDVFKDCTTEVDREASKVEALERELVKLDAERDLALAALAAADEAFFRDKTEEASTRRANCKRAVAGAEQDIKSETESLQGARKALQTAQEARDRAQCSLRIAEIRAELTLPFDTATIVKCDGELANALQAVLAKRQAFRQQLTGFLVRIAEDEHASAEAAGLGANSLGANIPATSPLHHLAPLLRMLAVRGCLRLKTTPVIGDIHRSGRADERYVWHRGPHAEAVRSLDALVNEARTGDGPAFFAALEGITCEPDPGTIKFALVVCKILSDNRTEDEISAAVREADEPARINHERETAEGAHKEWQRQLAVNANAQEVSNLAYRRRANERMLR
jgi:hypothetical protein